MNISDKNSNQRIAIVVYKSDAESFQTVCKILGELSIPEGYTTELLETSNLDRNIGNAYNEAMDYSDAEYKLYVSEEVEWIDPETVSSMLAVLRSNSNIAAVGVNGHNQALTNGAFDDGMNNEIDRNGNRTDIVSIDCNLIMTSRDIRWRDDLFTDPEVLVNAQCMEYRKAGYFVSTLACDREWIRVSSDSDRIDKSNDIERYMDEYSYSLFPLVSILIPTHERPDLFKIALDSALAQTYRHTEIIISDNSKDDRTEELIKTYLADHRNIKYMHSPGMGANDNWENCWKHISSDSEYTNFLMDDDVFMPNKIAEMVNFFLMNPQITLVTSYRQLIDAEGRLLPDAGFNARVVPNTSFIRGEDAGRMILVNCTNWIGEPTTVLYKSKYIVDYLQGWTGTEKYALHDYSMWLRLLEHGDMVYITEPLSQFRQHGNNDSKNFKINIIGTSSMATVIQEAWNKKVYLNTSNLLKQAIRSWYNMANGLITYCFAHDIECEEFDDLLIVYREMGRAFTDREPGDIVFDFPDPYRKIL